jgi:methylated-DNA-[protein]-cysteine S-methyltransferase
VSTALGTTWFDTAIGQCGLSWNEHAIVRAYLPGARPHADDGAAAPAFVRQAIGLIRELLSGGRADLSAVPIDLSQVSDFNRRVYEVTCSIPPGRTLTYGQVAERIGEPGAAQAVGKALGANPIPIVVPCHRVVGADGKLVGFSAPGGTDTKRAMLVIEGAIPDEQTLF